MADDATTDDSLEWPLYLLVYAHSGKKGEGKLRLTDDVAETRAQRTAIRGLGLEVALVYRVTRDGESELVYFEDYTSGVEWGEWPDDEPISVSHYGDPTLNPSRGR